MKAFAGKLVTLPLLAVYFGMISEGLRVLIAASAQKVYKLPIPGLIYLGRWSPWNKLAGRRQSETSRLKSAEVHQSGDWSGGGGCASMSRVPRRRWPANHGQCDNRQAAG